MKTIVTAGWKGADIDVFACAVAYAELLRLEGFEAVAVIPGSFTASVTPSLLELNAPYETSYTPDGSEQFVLVDISDPRHFAQFVDHSRITEIYDHRYGYENFWQEKLGENSHVEMVGSCGTLIWEEFKKRDKNNQISSCSAKLLQASIVSNNLAMKSELTTERDTHAFEELKLITGFDEKWVTSYYLEQEASLFSNFEEYVKTDTKKIDTKYGDFVVGQIEVWEGKIVIDKYSEALKSIMEQFESTPWMVNIISVGNGYNYLYTTHKVAKDILEKSLGVTFDGNVAKTDKLLMRKYLMKLLQS